MLYYATKLIITAVLVVLVSEVAKRSSVMGAVLASIPLVSVLGIIWLYVDTGDKARVANLAGDILWLVVPSLVLFAVLPPLLKAGWNFWRSLGAGTALTVMAYGLVIWLVRA